MQVLTGELLSSGHFNGKNESYLTHLRTTLDLVRLASKVFSRSNWTAAMHKDGPIHLRQSVLKAASFEKQLRLLMSRPVRAYIIRLDKVTAHHTAELSSPLFVRVQKETFTIGNVK